MSPTFRHPDGTSYHVDHEPDNDGKGYPIRWVDFGQPRLQLIVPPYFDRLCREQGTTPQEVYDSGLGPPCNVEVYDPTLWQRMASPPLGQLQAEWPLAERPPTYGRDEWLAEVRARIEAIGGRVLGP